ncbi:hypothetical protein KKC60_00300, partial [Patescibacteria group bacterium]|nr:hypothetical protein [Patescibacteria group bacterium]
LWFESQEIDGEGSLVEISGFNITEASNFVSLHKVASKMKLSKETLSTSRYLSAEIGVDYDSLDTFDESLANRVAWGLVRSEEDLGNLEELLSVYREDMVFQALENYLSLNQIERIISDEGKATRNVSWVLNRFGLLSNQVTEENFDVFELGEVEAENNIVDSIAFKNSGQRLYFDGETDNYLLSFDICASKEAIFDLVINEQTVKSSQEVKCKTVTTEFVGKEGTNSIFIESQETDIKVSEIYLERL